MRSPPALVATIPPTVAESRAARSTPKARPASEAAPSTAARVAPAPTVTWPAATSTGSMAASRRRLTTTSPCSGTPPPTRPVLPPWGTTGRPADESARPIGLVGGRQLRVGEHVTGPDDVGESGHESFHGPAIVLGFRP